MRDTQSAKTTQVALTVVSKQGPAACLNVVKISFPTHNIDSTLLNLLIRPCTLSNLKAVLCSLNIFDTEGLPVEGGH